MVFFGLFWIASFCVLLGLLLIDRYLLKPLRQRPPEARRPWQFSLPDLFSLVILLHAPVLISVAVPRGLRDSLAITLVLLFCGATLTFGGWLFALRSLRCSYFESGWQRFCLLTFVLPVGMACGMLLPAGILLTGVINADLFLGGDVHEGRGRLVVLLIICAGLAGVFACCAWWSERLARRAQP